MNTEGTAWFTKTRSVERLFRSRRIMKNMENMEMRQAWASGRHPIHDRQSNPFFVFPMFPRFLESQKAGGEGALSPPPPAGRTS